MIEVGGFRGIAGKEAVGAAGMFVPFMVQAAEERELVRDAGQPRQQLGDLHAGDGRANRFERAAIFHRCRRLEIEEVDMARSAVRPKEDDREVLVDLRLLLRRDEYVAQRRL